jgi:putative restriction endonuclease
MNNRPWSREELVVALNLYLKIPFAKIHYTNPDIIKLAKAIGRTNSSVSMRLSNYAACDPYHSKRGVIGLRNGMSVCLPIWEAFEHNREKLLYESELILAKYENTTIEKKFHILFDDISNLEGKDAERLVKIRVNQNVFRQIVLSNYDGKCAISGIDIPDLLVASHIIPWSISQNERMNPENGICLSALYDKAYDKGMIGINTNLDILLSPILLQKSETHFYHRFFEHLRDFRITRPEKYLPKKEFLDYHLNNIFQG